MNWTKPSDIFGVKISYNSSTALLFLQKLSKNTLIFLYIYVHTYRKTSSACTHVHVQNVRLTSSMKTISSHRLYLEHCQWSWVLKHNPWLFRYLQIALWHLCLKIGLSWVPYFLWGILYFRLILRWTLILTHIRQLCKMFFMWSSFTKSTKDFSSHSSTLPISKYLFILNTVDCLLTF